MRYSFAFFIVIAFTGCFRLLAQEPVEVAESTLKIGGLGEEVFYYGFAEGDQLVFNFLEVNGKELKEVEIIEYPSNSKFSDYKSMKIEKKTIQVNRTSVYKFRFYNSALSGRICKIKIQRIPANDQTKNFNTNVSWITRQDTTWNTYTRDVITGYDTTYQQKIKKELVKTDTIVTQLFDKTERVFSEMAIGHVQYSYVNVLLPDNLYSPNRFNPYSSKEVISWSYWIGVGQTAKAEYEKANSNLSLGISVLGALTGYGALAKLAISGISIFGTPSVGDNVKYTFITMLNGQRTTLDFGNGISACGRNDKLLQGGFTIELFNDNFKDGIDATVKVIAVQVQKTWQDKQYTEQKVTARHEEDIQGPCHHDRENSDNRPINNLNKVYRSLSMKKYFIHNGKEQEGPFSLEDLKQIGITDKTMVWFDGIQAWTEAQYIPELKEVTKNGPPPFTRSNPIKGTIDKTKKVLDKDIVNEIENKIPDKSGKKIFKWFVTVFAFIGLIVVGSYLINQTPLAIKGDGSPVDSLVLVNPKGSAEYSEYNNKWILQIKGELFNKSVAHKYKDFIVEVQFLSETHTLLTTKKYTLYKAIEPLDKEYLYETLDGDAPEGSSILKWKIIGATGEDREQK